MTNVSLCSIGYEMFVLETRVDAAEGERCRKALVDGAKRAPALDEKDGREAERHGRGEKNDRMKTRVTIVFAEPVDLQRVLGLMSREVAKFDVLALEPTSAKAFASACANKHADLVTIRANARLPYKFTSANVKLAVTNKISFEVSYVEALKDSAARVYFFSNAAALVRATRGGRELFIISSGATRAMDMRSMHDVVNLATFFGMTEHAARAAMTTNVHAMLALSARRRNAEWSESRVERMDVDAVAAAEGA